MNFLDLGFCCCVGFGMEREGQMKRGTKEERVTKERVKLTEG